MIRSCLAFVSLASLPFAALAQPVEKVDRSRGFANVVATSFARWDKDHNGELSAAEIDELSVSPVIKGNEAAAIASLKLIVRGGKYQLPRLTQDYLTSSPPPSARQAPSKDDDDDNVRGTEHLKTTFPDFQAKFSMASRNIKNTNRDLFRDATPDIDHCRQGPLGDCFFVSMVGAAVYRDSQFVRRAIKASSSDGGYDVTFGGGKSVHIPALTDAEIGITSHTGDEGLWLPVMEKAFGTMRNDSRAEDKKTEQATDAIAHGGSIGTSIRVLTGHDVTGMPLRSRAEKEPTKVNDLMKTVDEKLSSAMSHRLLVGASTGKETLPPGINGHHAYAVLGYDARTRVVRIWNPHGNTFRPKGVASVQNGYPTKAGMFDMPLRDFVSVFNSITLEKETAAPPVSPAPSPAGGAKKKGFGKK